MSQQKKFWLISDVISHFAPYRVYGTAGTEVSVLHDHLDMMIVQDAAGNIFHCRTDNLTTSEKPNSEPAPKKAEQPIEKAVKASRGHRKKAITNVQSNLF